MRVVFAIAAAALGSAGCDTSASWHLSSSSPSSSSPSPSTADARSAWTRFTVRDQQLDAETDKAAGFTCDGATGTYMHACVQFLDDRCKARPTKIGHVSFSSDLPGGQSCFMDSSTGATYLDRKIMEPPLSAVWLVGTDTHDPRTYQIHYTFADNVLAEDSQLGKALVAKYGEPSYKSPPNRMSWSAGSVQLTVDCGPNTDPQEDYCRMEVNDTSVLDAERAKQKTADETATRNNAPPPPAL
jgi:hypothetical protein